MPLDDALLDLVKGLTPDDAIRLRQVLGLEDDAEPGEVTAALAPFAVAGAAELVDQFTGRQVPGRIKDQEQYRLLKLALHVFEGRLPEPDRVAELFQKNASESKTLLRNTAVRYRYELARSMDDYAWATLIGKAEEANPDEWKVEVRDSALLEHMTEAVRRGPGNPTGIEKTGEMHVYGVDKRTMTAMLVSIGHTYEEFVELMGGQ